MASSSSIDGGGGSSSNVFISSSSLLPSPSIKTIRFSLGKGNKTDGKLIVVEKKSLTDPADGASSVRLPVWEKKRMPEFIKNSLLHEDFLGSIPPKVLISVTGAAGAFHMDAQVENIFCTGLVNAAKSTTAWIVSGGTDVGIMHYVGEAIRKLVTDVPTIGFATFNKINNRHLLKTDDTTVEFDASDPVGDNVNLNPNHSHFVLVESHKDVYGEEIEARSDFEEYICQQYQVPLCLIVVNGGPGTLQTVAEGAERKFPVVILDGSGRAADAIAREIKLKRNKQPLTQPETCDFMRGLNGNQLKHFATILENENYVTIFTPDSGPLDMEILKSIISCTHGTFLKKMALAVEWNRPDLAEHIIAEAHKHKIPPEELSAVLSKSLETALDLDKPELFRLLSQKGAHKADIDLTVLYTAGPKNEIDPGIERYAPHLNSSRKADERLGQHANNNVKVSEHAPLMSEAAGSPQLHKSDPKETWDFVQRIFDSVDPIFSLKYAKDIISKFESTSELMRNKQYGSTDRQDYSMKKIVKNDDEDSPKNMSKVRFTDAMLWAILMGKLELAKVIWETTTLPIHAALIGAGLCKSVAKWLTNEAESFLEVSVWFEGVAIKLLNRLEYDDAKTLLTWKWREFGMHALEIAERAECKDFVADTHVQRYLDELLYSNDKGGIPPGTSMWKVILCIILPFFIFSSKTYDNKVDMKKIADGRWYHFYTLPYTKFWTSTFCYLGYLVVLAIVLVGYQGDLHIEGAEILLWIWMFGYAVEELSQLFSLREEGYSYFKYVSNQMDMFIIVLQILYVALAIAASAQQDRNILNASTDFLIVLNIISFVRFLDVFSISKDLGPLYFVLQKIISDVMRWVFVFLLFAIGFQVSFMALSEQLGNDDKWTPTIDGGSFMGSFYTLIGDWGTTMDVLKTSNFGVVLVSVYAVIAQIMLVNLLIAMMGDTFNSVKENSDKEWKFSRYSLIEEYTSTSFHPPPFNLLVIPFKTLYYRVHPQISRKQTDNPSPKKAQQFKNLMQNTKDGYLEDTATEQLKTIESVSDVTRNLTHKVDTVSKHVNVAIKQELVLLQASLINAIKGQKPPPEIITIPFQNAKVPVTWNDSIQKETVQKVLDAYKPFKDWMDSMNKPINIVNAKVNAIHIQAVDIFGPRIGFVKFVANVVNSTGQPVPGIVFMRGAAVAILVVLKLVEEGAADNGKEFTILTIQPRVPIGESAFAEIPAGMLDGGDFVGVAAKELKEETGIDIKKEGLIDLTEKAYKGTYHGVYPSAGGCDEFLRLFVHRSHVTRSELQSFQDKLTGLLEEGEKITLKVVPLDHLHVEAPDAKALSALLLYHKLQATGEIPTNY